MNQSHAIQSPGEPSARTLSLMLFLGFLLLTANILIWLGGLIGKPYGYLVTFYTLVGGVEPLAWGGRWASTPFPFLSDCRGGFDHCLPRVPRIRKVSAPLRVRHIGNTLDSMHKVALSYKPVIALWLRDLCCSSYSFLSTGPLWALSGLHHRCLPWPPSFRSISVRDIHRRVGLVLRSGARLEPGRSPRLAGAHTGHCHRGDRCRHAQQNEDISRDNVKCGADRF